MKRCPQCDQVYSDETLNFCLTDGAPLNPTDSQATVAIPQPLPQPVKKNRTLMWVGLGVLVLLVGGVGFAGILLLIFRDSGETANVNNQNKTASPSPKTSATPKPSPSPSPTASTTPEVSPTPDTKATPKTAEIEEVTPISWSTSATTFTGKVGQIYRFQCPAKGTAGAVWGSDIYTRDSSICTAAVHAGVITLESGGQVTVEFRPGRQLYGSTERNGITSNTFGEYDGSFVVR